MHQKDVNIYRRKAGRLDALCQGRKIESRRHSTHKKGHTAARKKRAGHKSAPVIEAPGNNPILFKEAAVLWMKARTGTCKGATVMKYDNLLRRHILPSLGGHELSEINTVLLADFMHYKLNCGRLDGAGGLSPSYVKSIMMLVMEIVDFAAEEKLCTPIRIRLRKPFVEKREPEILALSMQSRLEGYLLQTPDETNIGILLSLGTGLRISEVCALRWADIDFQGAILHVRATVTRVRNSAAEKCATKLVIGRPKTKASLRDIPIPKRLMYALLSLYEKRKSEYVISEKQDFVSPRTYEYRFHKVLVQCGIPSVHYHVLRHTFATRCIEFGVDVKTLSEILGHANVSITLNTYVHSSIEPNASDVNAHLYIDNLYLEYEQDPDLTAEIAALDEEIGSYTPEIVKRGDRKTIEALADRVDALLDGENLTEAERDALKALREKLDALLDRLAELDRISFAPSIIEGAEQTWHTKFTDGARFCSDASFDEFVAVEVDGKVLTAEDYTVSEGTTVAVLEPAFLRTLSADLHSLRIISLNGHADTTFTIVHDKTTPQTGDDERLALWFGILAFSATAIAAGTLLRKKKEH